MIVDIGGGTAEIAVISLGGIVSSGSVRIGGTSFDEALVDFIRHKYNLAIGEGTAEEIKIAVGSALLMEEPLTMDIKGRDMITGLPRIITVTSDDTTEALQHNLGLLLEGIKDVLHTTPPELSADVMEKGIVLSGGSSLLRNIDQLIAEATGVPTFVAEEPLLCVAKGTGIALENLESYKKSILATK
jgi:rod shape-determining protein MreB